MRRIFIGFVIAAGLLVAVITFAQQKKQADIALQAAIRTETVENNVKSAIEQYKKIIAQKGASKDVVANALVRLGGAYEKQGSAEARPLYERVIREFPDQKDAAAEAGRRLTTLGVPPPAGRQSTSLVLSGNVDDEPVTPVTTGALGERKGNAVRPTYVTCTGVNGRISRYTSVSLDGRWMAATDPDSGDIGIRNMSTEQTVRLKAKAGSLEDPGGAEMAVLSPDMRQVAYTWCDEKEKSFQLRIILNEVGAKPQVLVDNPDLDFNFVTWFPDGKSILAACLRTSDKTHQLVRISVSDHSIKVFKTQHFSYSSNFPSLSPDGRYAAYSGPPALTDANVRHIYIVATDGSGSETELVKTANRNQSPIWTPDGAHILFTSDVSGKSDLWAVAVLDGKVSGPVKEGIGDIQPIGMTRSGSYYYVQSRTGIDHFSIAELTPNTTKRNIEDSIIESFVGLFPTWSPDGKFIAFKRHHPGATTNEFDLVVRTLESGDERTYPTSHDILPGQAIWFHDSKSVYTPAARERGVRDSHGVYYRVDLETGEFKELLNDTSGVSALAPDDKTLYRADRNGRGLIAIDLDTRQERQIFAAPETSWLWIALSPDGRTLALYWRDKGTLHVARVAVDGSGFRELFTKSDEPYFGQSLAWDRDGRSILFAQAKPEGLMRVPVDGRASASMVFAGKIDGMNLSRDGSRIAFSDSGKEISELLSIDNVPALLKN